jgi:hypothetical protein
MKTNSMRLQLYVLVPLIFAGLTALAALHDLSPDALGGGDRRPHVARAATAGGWSPPAFLFGLLICGWCSGPWNGSCARPRTRARNGGTLYGRRATDFTVTAPLAHTLNRVTKALNNLEAQTLFRTSSPRRRRCARSWDWS